MQYIGFSDIFGRFIDQIPNLAIRLGQFLLSFIRRFLANPLGFATMILGTLLTVDLIDKITYEFASALSTIVNTIQNNIQNTLSGLSTTKCGSLDFVCYIRNGLVWFAQTILTLIFSYVVKPLLGAIGQILSLVAYITKTIMYHLAKLICSYVDYVYPIIAGGYVAYRAFSWIGIRLLTKLTITRILTTALGTFASFFIGMALSKALLDLILNLIGISCTSLSKPTVPTITTPITPSVTPPQIGVGTSYGLSYTGTTGRYVENMVTTPRYTLSISQSQGLKQVRTVSGTYTLVAKVVPTPLALASVAVNYGLTPTTAPSLVLAFVDSETGLLLVVANITAIVNESISYALIPLSYMAITSTILENMAYSISWKGTWGCSVSGTNITCTDGTAAIGTILLITASDTVTANASS